MIKYLFIAALFITNYSYANSEAAECSKIKSDSKRLLCYDLIYKKSSSVLVEKKVPVIKKIKAVKPKPDKIVDKNTTKKEDNFGLSYEQIRKAEKIEDKKAIRSSIVRVTKQVSRKITFRLENGQVWKSEAALGANKAAQFKKGSNIELVKVRMGGYSMVNTKTNSRIKVKRIK
jgi:hypothetical protein